MTRIIFFSSILFSVFLPAQETGKRIFFRNDSLWYAGQNHTLLSSVDKGLSWDTVFGKENFAGPVFFNGGFDTSSNVFVFDAKTIFIFGWDGTMHNKTILFCSSDYGKTWRKSVHSSMNGVVGVKYLHVNSPTEYFLYLRNGYYVYSEDAGNTWQNKSIVATGSGCFDDRFEIAGGVLQIGYSRDKDCKSRTIMFSADGGKTWNKKKGAGM